MAEDERPLWRVNERSFIGHSLTEEGGQVLYTPPEGSEVAGNLSPMNKAAQAVVDGQKGEHPDKSKPKAPKAGKAGKGEPGDTGEAKPEEDVA